MRHATKIVVALIVVAALGIWFGFPIYKHRYRLTVEIEVDGSVHSASSVIETQWHLWPPMMAGLFNGGIGEVRVYGQAVYIDLGSRGALLGLLWPLSITPANGAVGADFLAIRAFNPRPDLKISGYPLTWSLLRSMSWRTGGATLTAENLPGFMWLPVINDPASARPLLVKEFPSVFGDAVHFHSAWVEITDDPIATGLEKKLPWLTALRDQQIKQGISSRPGQFFINTYSLLGST